MQNGSILSLYLEYWWPKFTLPHCTGTSLTSLFQITEKIQRNFHVLSHPNQFRRQKPVLVLTLLSLPKSCRQPVLPKFPRMTEKSQTRPEEASCAMSLLKGKQLGLDFPSQDMKVILHFTNATKSLQNFPCKTSGYWSYFSWTISVGSYSYPISWPFWLKAHTYYRKIKKSIDFSGVVLPGGYLPKTPLPFCPLISTIF